VLFKKWKCAVPVPHSQKAHSKVSNEPCNRYGQSETAQANLEHACSYDKNFKRSRGRQKSGKEHSPKPVVNYPIPNGLSAIASMFVEERFAALLRDNEE
jgi:hypothetical protein